MTRVKRIRCSDSAWLVESPYLEEVSPVSEAAKFKKVAILRSCAKFSENDFVGAAVDFIRKVITR